MNTMTNYSSRDAIATALGHYSDRLVPLIVEWHDAAVAVTADYGGPDWEASFQRHLTATRALADEIWRSTGRNARLV